MAETRKILGDPELALSVTCIRVPVLRAHTEVIRLGFEQAVDLEAARDVLKRAPGVRLVDDRERNHFPMPVEATGMDDVLVGRLRQTPGDPKHLDLMVCGDQLLKGAALNAVQIAEALHPAA